MRVDIIFFGTKKILYKKKFCETMKNENMMKKKTKPIVININLDELTILYR